MLTRAARGSLPTEVAPDPNPACRKTPQAPKPDKWRHRTPPSPQGADQQALERLHLGPIPHYPHEQAGRAAEPHVELSGWPRPEGEARMPSCAHYESLRKLWCQSAARNRWKPPAGARGGVAQGSGHAARACVTPIAADCAHTGRWTHRPHPKAPMCKYQVWSAHISGVRCHDRGGLPASQHGPAHGDMCDAVVGARRTRTNSAE